MMNVNLNASREVMKISKVILDLSEMEDDYKRVIKYEKLISELESEYVRTVDLSNQIPCSVYFLKEAIGKYKELRRACEFRVLTKLCRRTSEEKAKKKGKRPLENDVSVESSAGGSSGGKRGEWWLGVVNSPMNKK